MAPEQEDDFRLVDTKLNSPRIAGSLVSRPRLIEKLNRSFQRLLTLVVAPAGYGKSTLVSAWLATRDEPAAWLSLDEDDSDLSRFLAYLLAAIQRLFPGSCTETASLLQSPKLAPIRFIAENLINELNNIDQSFVVVLDDYQAIRQTDVPALLNEILRYPPQNMHLVMLTRRNPPLPLPRLRARGQLTEIRTAALRFTSQEVATFMHQLGVAEIDEATISLLHEKTEGWVSGLRLVILSAQHRGEMATLLTGLRATNRYVLDYLMVEVVADLPPGVRDFLLKTSILGRLCRLLCEAVMGPDEAESSGQTSLAAIRERNLFIISLDDEREWYRYHHLFQQFLLNWLQQQLAADEIASLHIRAADWFSQNRLIEEALHHYLAAGDSPKAVQLLAQHRHSLMNQDRWQRLAGWLKLFPPQIIEVEPELLITQAWIKQVQWQLAGIQAIVARVERLLSPSPAESVVTEQLRNDIVVLGSLGLIFSARVEIAMDHLEQILTIIPQDLYYVRGYAMILLGYAYIAAGDPQAANDLVTENLQESSRNTMFHSRLLITLSVVYWAEAKLENLLRTAKRCADVGASGAASLAIAWGQYFQGCVQYQRGDLQAAENSFSAVIDKPYSAHYFAYVNSSIGLALVYQAQGRTDRAWAATDSIIAKMEEIQNDSLLSVVKAFQAELAARQGRLVETTQWASQMDPSLPLQIRPGLIHEAQLVFPKILLAQNTVESRRQADTYLARLRNFVEAKHSTRFLIEVLALQALLHQAQGHRPAALDTLAQAITLAQPSGFIRLFVDLGPELEPLLFQLAQSDVAPAYITQILAAFDGKNGQEEALSIPGARQPVAYGLAPEPLSALTNREMDVLLLLAERLTNKEIAQELGISVDTVKQHSINIYRKLGVNNRRQAAIRAQALGILPAD